MQAYKIFLFLKDLNIDSLYKISNTLKMIKANEKCKFFLKELFYILKPSYPHLDQK